MALLLALFCTIFDTFDVEKYREFVTLKFRLWLTQLAHARSAHPRLNSTDPGVRCVTVIQGIHGYPNWYRSKAHATSYLLVENLYFLSFLCTPVSFEAIAKGFAWTYGTMLGPKKTSVAGLPSG